MEFIKDYLALGLTAIGGIGAWFNLKSDLRHYQDRVVRLEKERPKTEKNSQDIRELQLQHESTKAHRETVNKLLEKLDTRMEKQDEKMDRMLTAITQVDTKLQERTKELHS